MQAANAPAVIRQALFRIRLVSSIIIGIAIYVVLPSLLESTTRGLIAWNGAIVVYLVMVGFMMAQSTHETMRRRARELDEGRYMVLILAMIATISSLAAIIFELSNLKNAAEGVLALHIGLSVATIVTSWSFAHVIFTEHYAHAFYSRDDDDADSVESQKRNGLHFPGQPRPEYLDFLYFSFTIGVANQTADTEVVSRGMRSLVLIHSIISYFFNTIILALTINFAASLLGS